MNDRSQASKRQWLRTSNLLALSLTLCIFSGVPAFAATAPAASSTPAGTEKASGEAGDAKHPYNETAIRHYNRGHDLHQQGFFNQAIAEYKAALAADERMEEAYTNLGLIYAAQRNYAKATDAFRKSLALNPRRPNALNGLATVLYARNKVEEAMQKWKEAVTIDPRFASAFYNMGNAMENEKDFKGAVEAYNSAISINPGMADAYFRIGSIYAKQKHPAQATILLSKAVQLDPQAEFVHEAKKTLSSLEGELQAGGNDEPEVKMNILPPPTEGAEKTGGS